VKCWGANFYGQLGQGDTTNRGDNPNELGDNLPAINLGTGRTATAITAGQAHTCALLDNNTVKCWGFNGTGQLGVGSTHNHGDGLDTLGEPADDMGDNLPIINLGTGRTATAITAGGSHTCAIRDNTTTVCWGNDQDGTLGQGTDERVIGDNPNELGDNIPVINLGTGRTALTVTAGNDHTCTLLDNATVTCWGANFYGQLGQGDGDDRGDNPNELGDNLPAIPLPALIGPAALTATLTGNLPAGQVGDTITYTATLRNTGSQNLTNITIVSNTAAACSRTLPTLNRGDTATYTCTDTLAAGDVPTINHHLTITTSQGATATTRTITTTVTPPPTPDRLQLTVSATPQQVTVGDTITYTVNIANGGATDINRAVTVTSADVPSCNRTINSLTIDQVVSYTCTHTTTSGDVPSKQNRLSATATGVLSGAATATTTVSNPARARVDAYLIRQLQTVGQGTYSQNGTNQTLDVERRDISKRKIDWYVRNSGQVAQRIILTGDTHLDGHSATYRTTGGRNITRQITGDGYRTTTVRPGRIVKITIRFTRSDAGSSPSTTRPDIKLTATAANSDIVDVVRIRRG
jgi:uncharacterized repeat protein (TIGR01451 family)